MLICQFGAQITKLKSLPISHPYNETQSPIYAKFRPCKIFSRLHIYEPITKWTKCIKVSYAEHVLITINYQIKES